MTPAFASRLVAPNFSGRGDRVVSSSPFPLASSIKRASPGGRGVVAMSASIGLLVLSSPDAPELELLRNNLPDDYRVIGIGNALDQFSHLNPEDWNNVDCLLNCGILEYAAKRDTIEAVWSRVPNVKWLHLASAGIEHVVFPALIESDVVLTNARGCFSHSLAEFALFGCKYFALDFPRLQRAKNASNWEPYTVEELRGKRMGIVGYGDIGATTARLAKAFGMHVVGLRRRTELTEDEVKEGIVEKMYGTDQLAEMVSTCDYVVMSTPFTPQTHKMFGKEAIAAMKKSAVFVNIGRGKCVDEDALVDALEAGRIRGAVLDVAYTEPLPRDSKLWGLPNVILSPHCADRTDQFQFDAMELFLTNAKRFASGEELLNTVDKKAGY